MARNPFFLTPEMPIVDAMRATMLRHYPVYPVCRKDGTLIGVIRGQMLFEAETVELSLQAGSMVGVEKRSVSTHPGGAACVVAIRGCREIFCWASLRQRSSGISKGRSIAMWRWPFSCRC